MAISGVGDSHRFPQRKPDGSPSPGALAEAVARLFADYGVGRVVGHARGSEPLRARPAFIADAKEAEHLVFDVTCGNNLARLVRNALRTSNVERRTSEGRGRTADLLGVVAKGCDGRALVQYVAEGQLRREDVAIVGVHCTGVLEPRKVERMLAGADPLGWRVDGDRLVVETTGGEVTFALPDVISDSCRRCRYPDPPVYDILVEGQSPKDKGQSEGYAEVEEFEMLGPEERWAWFSTESAKCIRCYACRNACPVCYCDECFVDQANPQWFGKSTELADTMMFHLVRSLHNAGRCVDCGACERACPLGVKLGLLNKRIEKEVKERFGYVAGLSAEEKPALAAFSEDDRQEFIL